MKVLLINEAKSPDYLADLLYINLATNFGLQISTNKKPSYLYEDYNRKDLLYGRGFTLYGVLPRQDNIRERSIEFIEHAISSRVFDLIIYSSIRRCQAFWSLATKYYRPDRILTIDGEDDKLINPRRAIRSTYFKRELSWIGSKVVHPISFFMPSIILQKVQHQCETNINKKQLLAPCDPRNSKSYVYHDESDYYNQYASSYFGYTMKKSGWDCLRHYEIIASNCLPYFNTIHRLPKATMKTYPRCLQISANQLYHKMKSAGLSSRKLIDEYFNLLKKFQQWLHEQSSNSALDVYISELRTASKPAPQKRAVALINAIIFLSNLQFRIECKIKSSLKRSAF